MTPTIHATAVVVGPSGVLIRGPSGAGKSRLALAIVSAAQALGRFAALVADDRVHLEASAGRLLARTPPALAGLVERRGVGIERMTFERAAVVSIVVDLVPANEIERLPVAATVTLHGVALPRLSLPMGAADAHAVLAFPPVCDNLDQRGP